MSEPTIGEMLTKHQEIRAFVDAAQAAFDEQMKPYQDAMRTLNNVIGAELQRQGLQNFKGEDGTAYLQHSLSVKVDNRDDFLKFILDNKAFDYLDARVLKEPVQVYVEKHSAPPPGVKVEPFIKCIIRK